MPQQEPNWLTPAQQVVWRDSLAAVAWVREQLDADLRKYHLDQNEYEVLVVLSEAPDRSVRMSQLADESNQSRSRLTHTVGRMEQAGLIERRTATNDRRGVVATLTDKGFELLERAAVDHVTAVRRVLVDVVEPGDWEALGRAMKAVLAVADSDT